MNSHYAVCDCGWKSKRYAHPDDARFDGSEHVKTMHRPYTVVTFSTTEAPEL